MHGYLKTFESKENFNGEWADDQFDIDQYLLRENLVQPEETIPVSYPIKETPYNNNPQPKENKVINNSIETTMILS